MRALCPEIGYVPVSVRSWRRSHNDVEYPYASGERPKQAVCTKLRCPIKGCTRKVMISTPSNRYATSITSRMITQEKADTLKREEALDIEQSKKDAPNMAVFYHSVWERLTNKKT